MKNLYTYISPDHKLDDYHQKLIEIQIDNSLEYWNKEDIMLAFNFPFEYKGIRSIVVPDLINSQYPKNPRAIICSKVNVFIYLLESKILNELAWYHDFDAFQLDHLVLPTITKDLGVVCYGFYPQWIFHYWGKSEGELGKDLPLTEQGFPRRVNFGNVFLKPESLPILKVLLEKMDEEGLYEEDAMTLLMDKFKDSVQIMDQTYNLGIRMLRSNINIADKPLRVAHFPPAYPRWLNKFRPYLNKKLESLIDEKFTYIH